MTVLALHKPKPCDDVVSGLRALADRIEAGEIDWPVTTCIVVLGHTERESPPDEDGICLQGSHWDTYGYGPRTDIFTTRGLMMTALKNWGSDDQ
jgi:hypothetical protein